MNIIALLSGVCVGLTLVMLMLIGIILSKMKELEEINRNLEKRDRLFVQEMAKQIDEISDRVDGFSDILNKLIDIDKEFSSNIVDSSNKLVNTCKEHLCAVQTKCEYTNLKVEAMMNDLETFGEQLSVITDYIRERTVEKEPVPYQESLCDSCKYDDENGSANVCVFCRENSPCHYEPREV